MKRPQRPSALRGAMGLALLAAVLVAADGPKQTIDAGGLKFDAPKAWKSVPPASRMRRAELEIAPVKGDERPAKMVIYAFPGGAGTIEDNLKRWQGQFRDEEDGGVPTIHSKKVKGKNVEVTRAETHGRYFPPRFPGSPAEPDQPGSRLLGAIVMGDDASYYIRLIGPDKTVTQAKDDFDAMLSTIELDAK